MTTTDLPHLHDSLPHLNDCPLAEVILYQGARRFTFSPTDALDAHKQFLKAVHFGTPSSLIAVFRRTDEQGAIIRFAAVVTSNQQEPIDNDMRGLFASWLDVLLKSPPPVKAPWKGDPVNHPNPDMRPRAWPIASDSPSLADRLRKKGA